MDDSYERQPLIETVAVVDSKRKCAGIMTVIGGACLFMFIGCFFLWSNISLYVISYFHASNPDLKYDFIMFIDVILIGSEVCGYQIGSYLLQKQRWNPKLILCLGGGIALTSLLLTSFTTSLNMFVFLYGVTNGLGTGMCYFVPLVCAWEYFPEKQGLITGIMLGAYGFASFFFGLISTFVVNPNNV